MSVQVKLTAVKELNNSSTTSIVEISNFNFSEIISAIKEFLVSIQYEQGTNVSVDISNIGTNLVTIRQGLSVLGTQFNLGNDQPVIHLSPSGTATAKNFVSEDVVEALRLRLRVYGALPSTGVPGEIVYINQQGTRAEGVYVWLNSTGWTLLSGGGGSGGTVCSQEIILNTQAQSVNADASLISASLYLVPAPRTTSTFLLFINGQQVPIGDGTDLAPAYFSKDGGLTPSNFNLVDATDQLYFNPSFSGYELDTFDYLTLQYITDDPSCGQVGYTITTQIVSGGTTVFSQYGITIIGTPAINGPVTIYGIPLPVFDPLGSTLPTGFNLDNSVAGYVISDPLGVFANGAIVEFTMPQSLTLTEFSQIRIFHEVAGELVDQTILPGDIPGDAYVPVYATRKIYAQVDSFSPFYAIRGAGTTTTTTSAGTTTTTTSAGTTTTTTTCAPNSISYFTNSEFNPTRATFYGSPSGPFSVTFTDQYGTDHDLTGLSGTLAVLGWTFDLNKAYYAGITSVIGVYSFMNATGCEYTVEIAATGATTTTTTLGTTTTTTAGPTTTTTTQATTTTTTTRAIYGVELTNQVSSQIRVSYPINLSIREVRVPGFSKAYICVDDPNFEIPEGIVKESDTANPCPHDPIFWIPTTTSTTVEPTTTTTLEPTTTTTSTTVEPTTTTTTRATTTTTTRATTTTTTLAPTTTTTTAGTTTTTTTASPTTTTTTTVAPTTTTTTTVAPPVSVSVQNNVNSSASSVTLGASGSNVKVYANDSTLLSISALNGVIATASAAPGNNTRSFSISAANRVSGIGLSIPVSMGKTLQTLHLGVVASSPSYSKYFILPTNFEDGLQTKTIALSGSAAGTSGANYIIDGAVSLNPGSTLTISLNSGYPPGYTTTTTTAASISYQTWSAWRAACPSGIRVTGQAGAQYYVSVPTYLNAVAGNYVYEDPCQEGGNPYVYELSARDYVNTPTITAVGKASSGIAACSVLCN